MPPPWNWPDYRPRDYGNLYARDLLEIVRSNWGGKSTAGIRATRCINEIADHLGHSLLTERQVNYVYDAVVRAWGAPTQQAAADELDHPVLYPARFHKAKKLERRRRTRFLMQVLKQYPFLLSGRYRIKKAKKKSGRKGKKTGGKAKR